MKIQKNLRHCKVSELDKFRLLHAYLTRGLYADYAGRGSEFNRPAPAFQGYVLGKDMFASCLPNSTTYT